MAKQKMEDIDALMALFANVPLIDESNKSASKKRKQVKAENREVENIKSKKYSLFIAITIVEKILNKLKAKYNKEIRKEICQIFYSKITGSQLPDSFIGDNHDASALWQLRRVKAISEDAANDLKKAKIPFEENEIRQEGFMLNPEILFDQEVLVLMAKALKGVKELKKYKVFLKQQPITTYIVTDKTYEAISKIKKQEDRIELYAKLTSIAMSQPNLKGGVDEALELLGKEKEFSKTIVNDDYV